MAIFGALKKALGAGAREVNAAYGNNTDFLEACCAAAALVAAADGAIDESEKRKTISVIQNNPTLGKLYQSAVIEQTASRMFTRAGDASGKAVLARELDDLKTHEGGHQMGEDAYLIALDVVNADGSIGDKEAETLKKIAARMGVDPSKFEF